MAKFDAGKAVERLEYDFTEYGGGVGIVKEPSTGAVNAFFRNMKAMMKEVGTLQKTVQGLRVEELGDEEDVDAEQLAEQMSKMDEAEAGATKYQSKTIEYLAELCGAEREEIRDDDDNVIRVDIVGGSPSMEDLSRLPYRVLQAFSTWLIGEISPKKKGPGGKR